MATESTVPASTEPAPTSTSTTSIVELQPVADLVVLRPNGLSSVDFGTPADDAVERLSALLGQPDLVESIAPIGEGRDGCVEGAGWLDCLRGLRVVDEGRLAVWATYGLEVAIVDTSREARPRERTPLQFGDWHATVAARDARLVTEEGLYPGMTVRELRQLVPWVEFHYNEGLLDSFSATFGERGGYWGRLDWNPDTDSIESWDVSAVQAALNEHGADLVVDGEWGPRSEAAWLKFLTELGIEPFTLQPWLMPDIGEALGLPPDDITVATLGPHPPTATMATSLPILRPDGLGRFDFGDPADNLVSELIAVLGPPTDDTSYTPDGPGPFQYLPQGFQAAYELRIITWNLPGGGDGPLQFQAILSDLPFRGDHWDPPTPGTLTLQTWFTNSARFRLDSGIGVGSTVAELRRRHPEAGLGQWSVCEDPYLPASFGWSLLEGATDWDWVTDLQRALNAQGADLAVDGEYGPRTRAAVTDIQQALALDDGDGDIGPDTVNTLGLTLPDNAFIASLLAGYRSC